MSETGDTTLNLVSKALNLIKKHPTQAVPQAMQLAGFSESDRQDKNLRRAILRCLPGGGKRKFKELATTTVIPSSANDGDKGSSPLLLPLLGEPPEAPAENENPSSSSKQHNYKSRLTSEQKQKS
jgi:hypothetical protein